MVRQQAGSHIWKGAVIVMEDPSEKYLAEKLNQPNAPTIVKDGKVKFHGTVLRTILQRGPPRYFAAYLPTGVIYGVAYHYEELLPICQKIARVKKCDPKEVGINEFNGKSLYDSMVKGGMTIANIKPANIYASDYGDLSSKKA